MRFNASTIIVAAGLFHGVCADGLAQTSPSSNKRTPISLEGRLTSHVTALAADSMRGRGTPSREIDLTAEYVARHFQAAHLVALPGHESLMQRYPLNEVQDVVDSIAVEFPGGPRLTIGPDMALLASHASLPESNGELVVITGHLSDAGINALDLEGKTAVVLHRTVAGQFSPDDQAIIFRVMASNPYAIIVVSDLSDSTMRAYRAIVPPWRFRLDSGATMTGGRGNYTHPILLVRPRSVADLLSRYGLDVAKELGSATRPMRVVQFPGERVRTVVPRRMRALRQAPNVIGVLRGTDPALRSQYVVVSAHMDHLGVGRPNAVGDSIYHGADDNGSGTAALIEVARLMAGRTRPRRSVIFAAFSGEEVGMLGSEYFAGHSVDLSSVVADLNIDMVGHASWPDTIAALGGGVSTLGPLMRAVGSQQTPRALTPRLFTPSISFNESDQNSFIRRGVPGVQLFSGVLLPYYHTPDDNTAGIDFAWLARVTAFARDVAAAIANATERPRWTYPEYIRAHPRP